MRNPLPLRAALACVLLIAGCQSTPPNDLTSAAIDNGTGSNDRAIGHVDKALTANMSVQADLAKLRTMTVTK